MAEVEHRLARLPPLVTEEEIADLASRLAAVAAGEALLMQGGDCVERFEDTGTEVVRRKVEQLRELSAVIGKGTGLPVHAVGRMGGQYAKPRTSEVETSPLGGTVRSYRGDAVNAVVADARLRTPDPWRMLTAYNCARLVLARLRETWTGLSAADTVFASHELLLLPYERALRRALGGSTYATSAHFGWIGERTRDLDGAHVEFARRSRNPVGIKIGPTATPEYALSVAGRINPKMVPGRLVFIVRMGAGHITQVLPPIVRAVVSGGIPVVWLCDPMHGNTFQTASGVKTRSLPVIEREIVEFVRVLSGNGAWPGGLHLEMTPDPVTECLDTPPDRMDARADARRFSDYRSACDPRLNASQASQAVETFLSALTTIENR